MEKVDVHVHVFDKVSDEFPRQTSDLAPADREARAETLLEEMEKAGIDRAVLIDMGGAALEHHGYVTHCVRQWPERFAATGLVDMGDADPPARLRELVEETGIKGIRLGQLGDPGAERVEALRVCGLFEVAAELGLNINIYTRGEQVRCVGMLAEAFPGVTISLDHMGICPSTPLVPDRWRRPRFDDEVLPPANYPQVMELAKFPNIHIKVSGEYAFSKEPYPYGDMKPMVEQVYRIFGAGRMMWCSDFPWIVEEPGYGKLAVLLDVHLPELSAEEKGMIMGGNGLKVWFGE